MSKRSTFHKSHLEPFRAWMLGQGYVEQDPRTCWEVLRMKHPDRKGVVIVHTKLNAAEHYTFHGQARSMFYRWRNSTKGTRAHHATR